MNCTFCGREIELEEQVIELRNGRFVQPILEEAKFKVDKTAYMCSSCMDKTTEAFKKIGTELEEELRSIEQKQNIQEEEQWVK